MPSALLVIDVQRSFLHRPSWRDEDFPAFLSSLQRLIGRCEAARVPVVQVLHREGPDTPTNPFSDASGQVVAMPDLRIAPAAVFHKSVHSSMFGREPGGKTLDEWLRGSRIDHVIVTGIRTEQCCEATARHASDLGYRVTYAVDATLTFPMVGRSGREFSAAEIKERTELVLQDRFADVVQSDAVRL